MNKKNIEKAGKILDQGGIIIFPTDTAYGIGCRVDKLEAIKRLYRIKKRPKIKGCPVLISSFQMACNYSLINNGKIKELADQYWPGALTIVLPAKDNIPFQVQGENGTVGLRWPDHDIPLNLINRVKVPILGPSANFSGGNTPFKYQQLDKNFTRLADYVIEGDCPVGKVSTVINVTTKPWKVLRQGAVILDIRSKKAILTIDTSKPEKIIIGLEGLGFKDYVGVEKQAQDSLSVICGLLKKHNLSFYEIGRIKIAKGPGSYTGLRIGFSIANTLSAFLNIPKAPKQLFPKYS